MNDPKVQEMMRHKKEAQKEVNAIALELKRMARSKAMEIRGLGVNVDVQSAKFNPNNGALVIEVF